MHVRYMSQWQAEDGVVAGGARFDDPLANWHAAGSPLQQMRRWDLGQYLCDDLLVKVDRAAMSTSLETRAPLLDHRMVELAFALPDRALQREGQSKWVLRRVLDRYVPRHLIDRPKTGFSVPLAQWLRGPLREWAETLLDPAALRAQGFFNEAVVRSAWSEHLAGSSRDLSAHLWNIVMFQAWLAQASSAPAPAPAPAVPQRTTAAAL
jgi:asparagine synthase (glutamine-hydrolysing)